jgi:hypothetical protein
VLQGKPHAKNAAKMSAGTLVPPPDPSGHFGIGDSYNQQRMERKRRADSGEEEKLDLRAKIGRNEKPFCHIGVRFTNCKCTYVSGRPLSATLTL